VQPAATGDRGLKAAEDAPRRLRVHLERQRPSLVGLLGKVNERLDKKGLAGRDPGWREDRANDVIHRLRTRSERLEHQTEEAVSDDVAAASRQRGESQSPPP
jgi:hypothetical protein